MNFFKRSFSVFLVFSMLAATCLLSALPNTVHAADSKTIVKTSYFKDNGGQKGANLFGLLDKLLKDKISPPSKKTIKPKPHSPKPSKETVKPPAKKPGSKPPSSNKPSQNDQQTSPVSGLNAYEQEAVNLLNADRKANGLPALKVNMNLVKLAENYASDMIARGFFNHQNPEGLSPFDRMNNAGISYRWAGENLAINSSVAAAQKALMASSGHRANILNPNYTQVGIGVKKHSNGSLYVVQEFIGL